MKYFVTLPSGREHTVEITESAAANLSVKVDGDPVASEASTAASAVRSGRGATTVRVDGRSIELWLEGSAPELGVIADGQRFFARVESERMRIRAAGRAPGEGEGIVRSPMPGRVLRFVVKEGDTVALGAPVVVVEAMKMENELAATRAGVVKRLAVAPGATVESRAILLEIE